MKINKIYCGDCLELMKQLEDNLIDLIVTDPPYAILGVNSGYRQKWDTFPSLKNYIKFSKKWIKESYRILKNNSQVYIFWSQKYIHEFYNIIEQTDFEIKRQLIWFHPNLSKITNKMWLWKYDPIFFLTKGKIKKFNCRFLKNENSDVLTYAKPQSNFKRDFRFHPTSKPTELIELLIKISSNEKDLILDPFVGGGTTIVASIQQRRNFIGFEKEPKYCKISEARINKIKQQKTLL